MLLGKSMRSAQERHRRHSSEKRRRRQSWGKRPTKHHWKIETHDKNAYPKGKVHVWGGRRDDAHGVTQNLCRVPQEVALKTRQRKRRRKVLGTYVSRAARAIHVEEGECLSTTARGTPRSLTPCIVFLQQHVQFIH